jgi:hypothetical protein
VSDELPVYVTVAGGMAHRVTSPQLLARIDAARLGSPGRTGNARVPTRDDTGTSGATTGHTADTGATTPDAPGSIVRTDAARVRTRDQAGAHGPHTRPDRANRANPRPCPVCDHPGRDAIDVRLAGGETLAAVADSHGVSRYHAGRHRAAHLTEDQQAQRAEAKAVRSVQAPGPCTVCDHADREAIDVRLLMGDRGVAKLTRKYGVLPADVRRHRDHHIEASPAVRAALDQRLERMIEELRVSRARRGY